MKLHSDKFAGLNAITAYGTDYIQVNDTQHRVPLVVLPERLILPWGAEDFDSLNDAHFALIAETGAEIVLLGTGAKQRFVHPRFTRPLTEKRIGVECMDTQAACRTYNILLGESRKVAAALLFA